MAFIEKFGTDEADEIRKALGLKSVQAIYKWRNGDIPGLDTIIKISDVTGCSIHWLLIGKGSIKAEENIVPGKSEEINLEQLKLRAIQEFLVDQATGIAAKRREVKKDMLPGHQIKQKR